MRAISEHYERLPVRGPEPAVDEASVTRGKTVAMAGIPERDIPACAECHGPTELPKNPAYPRLTNQYSAYLRSQLMLMQERRRGGTMNVNLMHAFVNRLRPSEIRDVTDFYAAASPLLEASVR